MGQQQRQRDLGRMDNWAEHAPAPMKPRRRRREDVLLVPDGLSSYLCRAHTMCVSLSALGVVSTPPQ
jgi:hypothetical protein